MSESWSVRDGARIITFDGVQLAKASSERPNVPRWTDMALYLTDTGKYVLTKIGRTKVLHIDGCTGIRGKLNLFMDEYPEDDDPEESGFDLHTCVGETYYMNELLVEQTRYWAYIGDSADAIVEALHHNEDGVRSLPRMSISLLDEAMLRDPQIAEAYATERI